MSLSLARWENRNGSSKGYWMVRELPGVCLCRRQFGWVVDTNLALLFDWSEPQLRRVWGGCPEQFDMSGFPGDFFATRADALLALELFVSDSPRPALAALSSL